MRERRNRWSEVREGQAPQRLACACVSNRSPLDGGFCCSVNLSLANPIGIPPVRNSKIAIALPNEAASKGQLRHRNGKLEGKPKRTPKREQGLVRRNAVITRSETRASSAHGTSVTRP